MNLYINLSDGNSCWKLDCRVWICVNRASCLVVASCVTRRVPSVIDVQMLQRAASVRFCRAKQTRAQPVWARLHDPSIRLAQTVPRAPAYWKTGGALLRSACASSGACAATAAARATAPADAAGIARGLIVIVADELRQSCGQHAIDLYAPSVNLERASAS